MIQEGQLSVGVLIGAIGGLLALIVSIVSLVMLIRKAGENSQSMQDAVQSIKDWQKEDRATLDGIASEIKQHVTNAAIHVNPLVEQRDYDARMRFQTEVKADLRKLLEK